MPLSGQTMSVTNTYTPGAVITASGFNTNFTDFATSLTTVATALQGDLDANGNDIGFDDAHGIQDDSGNEQLIFQKTASAVNYVEITNAATGSAVSFAAAGDDTNIGLDLSSKGTGAVRLYSGALGRILALFANVASSVNYWTLSPSATGNAIIAGATGSDTNIIMRLDGKGTGGVMIEGTATNDDATAGYVGEVISSTVLIGSAVSLTSTVTADVTSISLTAGDWDVWGVVVFNPGASTTMSSLAAGINTASATLSGPGPSAGFTQFVLTFNTGSAQTMPAPAARISIAATTTTYLVTKGTFGVSTLGAYGFIAARRAR